MRYILLTTQLFIIMAGVLTTAQTHFVQSVEGRLAALKKEFAPDKRTAILDIQISEDKELIVISGETTQPQILQELSSFIREKGREARIDATVLPAGDTDAKTYGVVTVSVCNIRKGPDHPEELVTQSLMGTPVRILKSKQGWSLIQTPDSYIGWVDDDAIAKMNSAEFDEYLNYKKLIVTVSFTSCTREPRRGSQQVADLSLGNVIRLNKISGDFLSITLPDGRDGYISKTDATEFEEWLKSQKPSGKKILETAGEFTGIPYLWGGTSYKGVDCSGFTKMVYFMNGILLPRDASQQVNTGELVDTVLNIEKFKPGDLLFFGRRDSEKGERATHIGIYIGNGEFIHSSGRVRVNSFFESSKIYSDYRTKMFLKTKRVLGTDYENNLKIKLTSYYQKNKVK